MELKATAADGWCAPTPPDWWETVRKAEVERKRWFADLTRRDEEAERKYVARQRAKALQLIREGEIRRGDRLACGCTRNVLETGWHEFGCEVVGAHLCRQATRQTRVGRPSTVVEFSA